MLCLSEDDLSKLRSPVKAVRVGDETWLIPPSGHLTGPASFSASDWSSLPTYAACKSAPSFFAKQSTSRDVQSKSLYLKAPLAKKSVYIYRRHSQWKVNCNVVTCEEEGAIIIQGFPGDEDYTDAIFGRVAHIVEGFSGVEYFTVGNEL